MSGGSYCYCCFANYVSLANGAVNYAVIATIFCTSSIFFVFYFCFSRGMLRKIAVRLVTNFACCLCSTCCFAAFMARNRSSANITVVIVVIICACANSLFTIIASMRAFSSRVCANLFGTTIIAVVILICVFVFALIYFTSVVTNVILIYVRTCMLRLRGSRCYGC